MSHSQAENNLDCCWFGNKIEGVMVFNVRTLMKSFRDKTCFVPVNRAIRKTFSTKNPLTSNKVLHKGRRDKLSSLIPNKSIKLLLHSLSTFWIFESLGHNVGFKV